MNAKWLHVMVCAAVLGTGMIGVAGAVSVQVQPPEVQSNEHALEANAKAVAASLDISVEEARRRLATEQIAADFAEKVLNRYGDRLAGMYIEHDPKSRLVVRLTGLDAARTEFKHHNSDRLEVSFETGAKHTLAELREAIDRIPEAVGDMPGFLGGYVDERVGEVVIELDAAVLADKVFDLSQVDYRVASVVDVPVRFEAGESAMINAVYASGTLSPAGCTTGFTVYHAASNQNGVLTAGHCRELSGFATYTGHSSVGGTHVLGNQNWLTTAQADLLWLGNTSVAFGGYFYSNAWYAVTGRRTQGATIPGASYCKWGNTTGYTCGTVVSAYSAPGGSICGPTNTTACSATFVRIDGPANTCTFGDSGGPWFTAGTIAAGIHFASNASGSICWYTTTDYAYSGLGLQLLYP